MPVHHTARLSVITDELPLGLSLLPKVSHTRHNRFVFLAISGLNLGPPPLSEAWRLGPCSQGFRRSVALAFRLPGQVHSPMVESGFVPLLLRVRGAPGYESFQSLAGSSLSNAP